KHVEGNIITVNQSLNSLYSAKEVGELKSKHSYRTLSIPQSVVDKLDLSGKWVFATGYTTVCKDFRKWTTILSLKGATLHSLRHTHCTQFLARGINPVAVSRRMGHHSASFTLDRYAHLVPDMYKGLNEAIEDILD
ncbi:MAG: tyrosine-type recombinase/integrase, partial [Romboutsia sp.]|nr:tyrosine-type recombinase/integrase [Romboutsia sp.]